MRTRASWRSSLASGLAEGRLITSALPIVGWGFGRVVAIPAAPVAGPGVEFPKRMIAKSITTRTPNPPNAQATQAPRTRGVGTGETLNSDEATTSGAVRTSVLGSAAAERGRSP